MQESFERANESYETMMTAPRRDMGDSIQKAFANVDDILTDLGLETSEANERAVRILAYNNQEITEESILQMKAKDEAVQRCFRNMTPSVVREMIKEGINPLDMSIDELNRKAVEIKADLGIEEEERFSKYLLEAGSEWCDHGGGKERVPWHLPADHPGGENGLERRSGRAGAGEPVYHEKSADPGTFREAWADGIYGRRRVWRCVCRSERAVHYGTD